MVDYRDFLPSTRNLARLIDGFAYLNLHKVQLGAYVPMIIDHAIGKRGAKVPDFFVKIVAERLQRAADFYENNERYYPDLRDEMEVLIASLADGNNE